MARLSTAASSRMRRRLALVAVLGAALAICGTGLPLAPAADAAPAPLAGWATTP